jgi:hypothetical protein
MIVIQKNDQKNRSESGKVDAISGVRRLMAADSSPDA